MHAVYLDALTCAHMITRVRDPPPICCTHCPHSLSWDKPWVTPEHNLSSLQCVLIWINGTIPRNSGVTTVGWIGRKELHVVEIKYYSIAYFERIFKQVDAL